MIKISSPKNSWFFDSTYRIVKSRTLIWTVMRDFQRQCLGWFIRHRVPLLEEASPASKKLFVNPSSKNAALITFNSISITLLCWRKTVLEFTAYFDTRNPSQMKLDDNTIISFTPSFTVHSFFVGQSKKPRTYLSLYSFLFLYYFLSHLTSSVPKTFYVW